MNRQQEWEKRYEEKETPWDKGRAAPALLAFLEDRGMSGRVLVPGCGRGHEVRAIGGQPMAEAVGLDISPTAIAQARELSSGKTGDKIRFVEGDFFHLPESFRGSFDWLVEHTCFCAIDPHRRKHYALAAESSLKTGGKIFGIFYLNPDTESGPPFGVSKKELNELFDPGFILLEEWAPLESFPGRENREWIMILQKR